MGLFQELTTFGLYPWGKPDNGLGINGPLRLKGEVTSLSDDSILTFTMAQILGGYIIRDPVSDNRDDILPTATLFVQGMGRGAKIGSYIDFAIKNIGGGSPEDIDLKGGTNVAINPSAGIEIAPGETGLFRAVITSMTTPAVTVYCLGNLTEPTGT